MRTRPKEVPAGAPPAPLYGFHPDLPYAAYERDPALRFSALAQFASGRSKGDSAVLSFGRMVHSLALTPSEPLDQVVDLAGYRLALDMAEAFHASPKSKELLGGAFLEASLFWDDEATGVACKARLDLLSKGLVVDLKTTRSIDSFLYDAKRFGYFAQGAWYLDAANAAMGETFDRFALIAVEKPAPHRLEVFEIFPEWLATGRRENAANLARYRAAFGGTR